METLNPTPFSIQGLIPALPNELSIEIVLRLPIKSLLRFTTISKTWKSIITSLNFTKSHLQTSLSNPNYSHHHLLYYDHSRSTPLHFPLSSVLCNPPNIDPQDIIYPVEYNPLWEPSLIGSINGLVCLATTDENRKVETKIILWNPSTRKSRTLPCLERITSCSRVYGVGHDSRGEDYKVVAIFCVLKDRSFENYVKVYGKRSDSWKNIQGFKSAISLNDLGIFVNGKLHWPKTPCLDVINWKLSIVFVDVGDESYGELDQPNYGESDNYTILGVLGEWLCVLCNYGNVRMDFWVMKEYGVSDSWTKFVSLSVQYLGWVGIYAYRVPLCLLNNEDILFVESSTFMLYNPKDGSRRSIYLVNDWVNCALIYVESLVLP